MKYKNCKIGTKVRLKSKEKILARDRVYDETETKYAGQAGLITCIHRGCELTVEVELENGDLVWVNHKLLKRIDL